MADREKKKAARKPKPSCPKDLTDYAVSRKDYLLLVPAQLMAAAVKNEKPAAVILDAKRLASRGDKFAANYAPASEIGAWIWWGRFLAKRAGLIAQLLADPDAEGKFHRKWSTLLDGRVLCWLTAPRMLTHLIGFPRRPAVDEKAAEFLNQVFFDLGRRTLDLLCSHLGGRAVVLPVGSRWPGDTGGRVLRCVRPGLVLASVPVLPPVVETTDDQTLIAVCPRCHQKTKLLSAPIDCENDGRRYVAEEWLHFSSDDLRADELACLDSGFLIDFVKPVTTEKQLAQLVMQAAEILRVRDLTRRSRLAVLSSLTSRLGSLHGSCQSPSMLLSLTKLLEYFEEPNVHSNWLHHTALALTDYHRYLLEPPVVPVSPHARKYYGLLARMSQAPQTNPDATIAGLDHIAVESGLFQEKMCPPEEPDLSRPSIDDLQSAWCFWVSFWLHVLRPQAFNRFFDEHWGFIEPLLYSDWRPDLRARRGDLVVKGRDPSLYHAAQYMFIMLPKSARRMLARVRGIRPLIPVQGQLPPEGSLACREVGYRQGFEPGTVVAIRDIGFSDDRGRVARRASVEIVTRVGRKSSV